MEEREENLGKSVIWHVAMRPGKLKALPDTLLGQTEAQLEK